MNDVSPTTVDGVESSLLPRQGTYTRLEERRRARRRRDRGSVMRLSALLLTMAVVGGGFVAMSYLGRNGSTMRLPGSTTGTGGSGGSRTDDSYSWYHDEQVDSTSYGPQWSRDLPGIRSQETYDGPYDYSGVGSGGMRRRAAGATSGDPLYTEIPGANPDDVFALADRLNQMSAEPVGPGSPDPYATAAATGYASPGIPAGWASRAYDPYGSLYSNPYENRLRMTFADRSRWLDAPAP